LLAAALVSVGTAHAQEADPQDQVRRAIDQMIAERQAEAGAEPTEKLSPKAGGAASDRPDRMPAAALALDAAVIGRLPGEPTPVLRREGEFIIERAGQLVPLPELSGWAFVFRPAEGEPDLRPMLVQRCQRLASMQDTLEQQRSGGGDLVFTITGQVHTYRGVNYLLPTAIAGTGHLPDDLAEALEAAGPTEGLPPPAAEMPDDLFETGGAGGGGDGGGASFDHGGAVDLMEQMLADRPQLPARPDTAPTLSSNAQLDAALRGIKPAGDPDRALLREGHYLVHRAGRITRSLAGGIGGEAQNVMFAFEADGTDPEAAEPPMMLMPCKLLEEMEQIVAERGQQTVFLVSGRVHVYRGMNHLLPTTARVRVDVGDVGG
jgi:hypothetical protein